MTCPSDGPAVGRLGVPRTPVAGARAADSRQGQQDTPVLVERTADPARLFGMPIGADGSRHVERLRPARLQAPATREA
jgi:hypothetical protein